ncbi:hypothetical protein ACSXAB_13925 [Clostridium perfringens]
MIDLDFYTARSIDFKIDGEIVRVQEPPAKIIKKMTSLGKLKDEEKMLDKQYEIVVDILNNNTSSKKFTKEIVENYPQSMINAIISEITKLMGDLESSPN